MGKHTAPRKAGRPPKYESAMTGAERAQRYRAQRKERQVLALRNPATAPLVALFDELREAVRLGEVNEAKAIAAELVKRTKANA